MTECTIKKINNDSPKLFSQVQLTNFTRELNLPKEAAQILGSRLKEKNLFEKNTNFAWYRHREKEFTGFFRKVDALVYCTDVQGLIKAFGMSYQAENWRLFIDSSKMIMKAVFCTMVHLCHLYLLHILLKCLKHMKT